VDFANKKLQSDSIKKKNDVTFFFNKKKTDNLVTFFIINFSPVSGNSP